MSKTPASSPLLMGSANTPKAVERVMAVIPPTGSLVDQHPDSEAIRSVLVDWALTAESQRAPLTKVAKELQDRFGGDLGTDPVRTLTYFLKEHVSKHLVLSRAWMLEGAAKADADLNLLRQHYETLKGVDKALQGIVERLEVIDPAQDSEAYLGFLDRQEALFARREATLKAIEQLQLTMGGIQDERVQKSMTLHTHVDAAEAARAVMERTRRRAPSVIDVDP